MGSMQRGLVIITKSQGSCCHSDHGTVRFPGNEHLLPIDSLSLAVPVTATPASSPASLNLGRCKWGCDGCSVGVRRPSSFAGPLAKLQPSWRIRIPSMPSKCGLLTGAADRRRNPTTPISGSHARLGLLLSLFRPLWFPGPSGTQPAKHIRPSCSPGGGRGRPVVDTHPALLHALCGRGSDQLMPLKRPTWGAMLARPRLLRRGGRQRRPTPGRNQRWAPSSPWARPGQGANPSGFANGQ